MNRYIQPVAFLALLFLPVSILFSQNTYPWPDSGQVGIGTSGPLAKLHICQPSSAQSPMQIDLCGTAVFKVNEMGLTGIKMDPAYASTLGPSATQYALSVSGLARFAAVSSPDSYLVLGHDGANARLDNWDVYGDSTSGKGALIINGASAAPTEIGGSLRLSGVSSGASGLLAISPDGTISVAAPELEHWTLNGNLVGASHFIGSTNAAALVFKTSGVEAARVGINRGLGVGVNPDVPMALTPTWPRPSLTVNGYTRMVSGADFNDDLRLGHDGVNGFIDVFDKFGSTPGSGKLLLNYYNHRRTDVGGPMVIYDHLGIMTDAFTDAADGKDYHLSVRGRIRCEEVKVYVGWADHVFASDYHLMPLQEVKCYIAENGHLPGMPSAAQVQQQGVNVGEMESRLLEKVEELTLHLIQLSEENEQLTTRLTLLEAAR